MMISMAYDCQNVDSSILCNKQQQNIHQHLRWWFNFQTCENVSIRDGDVHPLNLAISDVNEPS